MPVIIFERPPPQWAPADIVYLVYEYGKHHPTSTPAQRKIGQTYIAPTCFRAVWFPENFCVLSCPSRLVSQV